MRIDIRVGIKENYAFLPRRISILGGGHIWVLKAKVLCVEREKQRTACVLISQEGLRGDPAGGRGAKDPSILIYSQTPWKPKLSSASRPTLPFSILMADLLMMRMPKWELERKEGYPSVSIRTPTDKLGSGLRKRNEIPSRILMF